LRDRLAKRLAKRIPACQPAAGSPENRV